MSRQDYNLHLLLSGSELVQGEVTWPSQVSMFCTRFAMEILTDATVIRFVNNLAELIDNTMDNLIPQHLPHGVPGVARLSVGENDLVN